MIYDNFCTYCKQSLSNYCAKQQNFCKSDNFFPISLDEALKKRYNDYSV